MWLFEISRTSILKRGSGFTCSNLKMETHFGTTENGKMDN